ncbi:hypothetical protein HPB52_023833 [Rhipicephalus sanguineus]|uniref:Uncharacterized protein n=1 Tax=Rhipicephalus sanguineus TaxID=34632 RepID=A0A9D4PTA9_RHISA|nr:hypothetical protein HPB52_023833 [Rhipicephalus sanguineus]
MRGRLVLAAEEVAVFKNTRLITGSSPLGPLIDRIIASAGERTRISCRSALNWCAGERRRRREAPRPGFGSAPDEEGRDPDHLSAPVAPPQSAADLTKHRQRSRAEDAAVAAVTVVRCFS